MFLSNSKISELHLQRRWEQVKFGVCLLPVTVPHLPMYYLKIKKIRMYFVLYLVSYHKGRTWIEYV